MPDLCGYDDPATLAAHHTALLHADRLQRARRRAYWIGYGAGFFGATLVWVGLDLLARWVS